MMNTVILKLNRLNQVREYVAKNSFNKQKRLELTQADIEFLIKEKEKMQKEKENLNITDEIRNKNVDELTAMEKDILYDEYVLDSAIEGTNDIIEGRYYTEDEFKAEMKKIEKEILKELKMMHN